MQLKIWLRGRSEPFVTYGTIRNTEQNDWILIDVSGPSKQVVRVNALEVQMIEES